MSEQKKPTQNKVKKLSINKDTVKELSDEDLQKAAGGNWTSVSYADTTCCWACC